MKQTAVDYLWHDLIANPGNYIKAYKQAKEMEKQQIVDAYIQGRDDCYLDWHPKKHAKEYYQETYETSNI